MPDVEPVTSATGVDAFIAGIVGDASPAVDSPGGHAALPPGDRGPILSRKSRANRWNASGRPTHGLADSRDGAFLRPAFRAARCRRLAQRDDRQDRRARLEGALHPGLD